MKVAGRVFPWSGDNRFGLLVDGPRFFPAMLEAIARARRCVDLELYLVEDGRCAEEVFATLVAAVERGVRVRCLFDGFGSMRLGQRLRDELIAAGVELRAYNPLELRLRLRNFHRDHRKILVVDGERGFIGGAGIADQFWSPDAAAAEWHEVMVEVGGPIVADLQQLFERQWQSCQRRRLWEFPLPRREGRVPRPPLGHDGLGRIAYAAARHHRDILLSLLGQLRRAERRIYLATPYFLPTGKVRRALVRAARRGVEVRLLLTGQGTDHPPVRYASLRYYHRLLQSGVKIHEYQAGFSHMKAVMVDDWVTLGSCNFDRWNLRWNLEANLEVVDRALLEQMSRCFHEDFQRSREVTLQEWEQRPLGVRIRQQLWGWLDRLLLRWLERRP